MYYTREQPENNIQCCATTQITWGSWTQLQHACIYTQLGLETAFHVIMSASSTRKQWSNCVSLPPAYYRSFFVFHMLPVSHPVVIKFSRKLFVFSCVALETSIKSPCCSPLPLSLKMTFDLRATKVWKRIERTETPHHHTRWCYLTYLDIPLLFVSLHHLILLITTGMRLLFFFLLLILIWCETKTRSSKSSAEEGSGVQYLH